MNKEENYSLEKKQNEIFSKALKAGKRTYFFDVRETKAGDYYLTITESKRDSFENGNAEFKKFKIYLYKEDFKNFKSMLEETTDFIIRETGEKVISERHQDDYYEKRNAEQQTQDAEKTEVKTSDFTHLDFEDI